MEESVAAGTPFYLQLSHYAVHSPVESRAESIDRFSALSPGRIHSDPEYGGMTWDLDASLGQVVDALQRLGIEDETYVVFMSDNGASGNRRNPGNTPLFAGKGTLYEGGIRVPLIIFGPGVETGYSGATVSGTDLFATFATWAGAGFQSSESEDLTPLLTAEPEHFARDHALLFHYPHEGRGRLQAPQTALISGRWKLLRDWDTGAWKLYDVEADPGEKNDLSAKERDVFDEMTTAMNRRLEAVGAQLPR